MKIIDWIMEEIDEINWTAFYMALLLTVVLCVLAILFNRLQIIGLKIVLMRLWNGA